MKPERTDASGGAPAAWASAEFSLACNDGTMRMLSGRTLPRYIARPLRQRGRCAGRRPGMRRTARSTRAGPSDDGGSSEPPERGRP